MPPLRVAVIGAGAFGRNHLRVYRELELANPASVKLAALVEPDATRRETLAAQYNIPAFATVTDLLASPTQTLSSRPESASFADVAERPAVPPMQPQMRGISNANSQTIDAASICVPTTHHAAVAEQLLLAGVDILIEKPFAASLDEADRILALAAQHQRIVAIGHLERFNPAVTATLAVLNRPMFFESHRLSVFTPRSLDVDVVLDLMIHDLDIVLSLTQSPVKEVRAVGLPVLSRKTDIANVRVEFDSGCVANFTASRVSTEQVRKLRLFQPHQYLSLDFARQELLTISVDPAILAALSSPNPTPSPSFPPEAELNPASTLSSRPEAALNPTSTLSSRPETQSTTPTLSSRPEAAHYAAAAERPAAPLAAPLHPGVPNHESMTQHPSPGLTLTKSDIPRAEPLRLELEDFLHAVRNRTQPRVPAEAGRAALSLALEINHQIAAHAHRAGLA